MHPFKRYVGFDVTDRTILNIDKPVSVRWSCPCL